MADLTQKQCTFIRNYVNAVDLFMQQINTLTGYKEDWDANGYATGAEPPENNITDEDCALVAPWTDALILNNAVGAIESVRAVVESNRGYLEAIRP